MERLDFVGRHRAAGPIDLATVSGVASTNGAMIDWFARNTPVKVITTKSIQLRPNPGNREPIITEPEPGSFGNAVGLRNPGLRETVEEFRALSGRRAAWPRGVLLNVSIAASDPEGFAELARALAPYADLIELNLSCPHAHGGYGSAIGCDPRAVEECSAAAAEAATVADRAVPVFAKLTPNVEGIGAIARRAIDAGATGIAAINTVGPDQYREPHSGAVILTNPAPPWATSRSEREAGRGRGGRSGRWVRRRAVECIAAIRSAVGPAVPLIGMGGAERPEDVLALRDAGADVVGVGSALALVHQREWPELFAALRSPEPRDGAAASTVESGGVERRRLENDTPGGSADRVATTAEPESRGEDRSSTPCAFRYRDSAGMAFRPFSVREMRRLDDELWEIELDGEFPFSPGEVCFLWIPGVGEKPYAPALSSPATFLVRRRGPVSTALCAQRPGDTVYVRGPYGEGAGVIVPPAERSSLDATHVTIVAAGSGVALVPSLAATHHSPGVTVEAWIGLRSPTTRTPLEGAIGRYATLHRVNDDGELGRVLTVMERSLRAGGAPTQRRLFAIGPDPFMRRAVEIALGLGVAPDDVHVSLEQRMMCGVGLCGLCHHDGVLTCRHGTFVSARRWPLLAPSTERNDQTIAETPDRGRTAQTLNTPHKETV